MFKRGLTRTLVRPASSLVPRRSTLSSSFFLRPVDLLPPLPASLEFSESCALRARGGVFLAVLAKTAKWT